ncbi:MAG TPA: crotonase/enoyl-CoA hydratase family protein [Polyangiaceae bacterium]|jgi:enoyl-CoA hydratase
MAKVTVETKGHVFFITLNRPEKRNAVDGETARLLHDAWIRFRDDDQLFVAVLAGAGDESFCAGADLSALDSLGPPRDASPAELRRFVTNGPGFMGYTRQTDIFKPIVAAINGHALAGGLELACLADMRVVAEHAEMGVACRRWNVPLVDGGTQRLPRIVGLGRAMEMILTGRFVGADEALRIGLANEIVPKGKARARATEIAEALCALPQGAMRTDKQAAIMGWGKPLEEGLRIEAELGQWPLRAGEDIAEGARAFVEKRAPNFAQDDSKRR